MAGTVSNVAPPTSVSCTVSIGSRRAASSCAKYCIVTWCPWVRVPVSGASVPARSRINVDLPEPFGPTSAIRLPCSIIRSSGRKISFVP